MILLFKEDRAVQDVLLLTLCAQGGGGAGEHVCNGDAGSDYQQSQDGSQR